MLRELPRPPVFSPVPVEPDSAHSDPVVAAEVLAASFSPDGRATYRDPAWKHLLGGEDDAWIHLLTADQTAARQCLAEAAQGTLVTHQVMSVERAERDAPVPVLLHFVPVYALEPRAVVAVSVTGEALAEPASWMLAQTRRHRMETLGRMTMGIAHDFNNLLSGVLGHAELLKDLAPYRDHADLREHVDTIERAALDGAEIVGRIQRFVRQEKEVEFKPLDLRELLNESITLTRPYWFNEPRRRGIQIELYTQLNTVPPIKGSGSELREVFVNLVLNAVQAMPRGGRLRLVCDHDTLRSEVYVGVQDSGTGMKPEVQARIFEPMFTTKGEQGTGMGLAVAYGIIQAHEGRIEVTSELGKGTIFQISFPLATTKEAERPTESVATTRSAARVLVVDDEPMVSNVLSKLLRRRGHDVTVVDNGRAALAEEARAPYDAVITDLGMPEMNGRTLAEKLRLRRPELPIILLSGDTEPGAVDNVVTAILSKPFRIEEVDATLQRVLGKG